MAILLSLWLNRYAERLDRWRRPEPFFSYAGRMEKAVRRLRLDDGLSLYLAILLPPVLLTVLLQALIGDWLLGLGELLLGLAALLLVHGPGQVEQRLQAFLDGWNQQRPDLARLALRELDVEPLPNDDSRLPVAAVEGLFWQNYRRLFAGVFWLLLLGPVGPVLVWAAALGHDYAERNRQEPLMPVAAAFLHTLDWLPARASALAFGFAGSFVHAVEGWRTAAREPGSDARRIVTRAGWAALHFGRSEPEQESVDELLRDARELVSRSLMVWLAVAALLTIAGWLY